MKWLRKRVARFAKVGFLFFALIFFFDAAQSAWMQFQMHRNGVAAKAQVESVSEVLSNSRSGYFWSYYSTNLVYSGPNGKPFHETCLLENDFSGQSIPIVYRADRPSEFLMKSEMDNAKSDIGLKIAMGLFFLALAWLLYRQDQWQKTHPKASDT